MTRAAPTAPAANFPPPSPTARAAANQAAVGAMPAGRTPATATIGIAGKATARLATPIAAQARPMRTLATPSSQSVTSCRNPCSFHFARNRSSCALAGAARILLCYK